MYSEKLIRKYGTIKGERIVGETDDAIAFTNYNYIIFNCSWIDAKKMDRNPVF